MTMLGRTYALTKPWWTWDLRVICDALEKARFELWVPVVCRALSENAKTGSHPSSFPELRESVVRDVRNLVRVSKGEYALTNQTALGLAVALKLPVHTFFPEPDKWITGTVLVLCEKQLSEAEASAYVAYRLHPLAKGNPHVDPSVVRLIFDGVRDKFSDAGAAERAISRCADVLGSILEIMGGELPK